MAFIALGMSSPRASRYHIRCQENGRNPTYWRASWLLDRRIASTSITATEAIVSSRLGRKSVGDFPHGSAPLPQVGIVLVVSTKVAMLVYRMGSVMTYRIAIMVDGHSSLFTFMSLDCFRASHVERIPRFIVGASLTGKAKPVMR
jgi:hypothetical protein